ncbi:MAG: hypothetical protein ACJ75F_15175 [Flavisolibacter sp.]|jgi:hypothetical protein
MKSIVVVLLTGVMVGNTAYGQGSNVFSLEKHLPKELKEISGVTKDGNALWAIADNSKNALYKLDLSGNISQKYIVNNVDFINAEAVTNDQHYVYIGDVGDNAGTRPFRSIIRISKSDLNNKNTVRGEEIRFTFPDEGIIKKKKQNDFDCEAIMNFHDSIYLFTKRRDDGRTELYVLPKSPGSYVARSIGIFKVKGLITDAAVNPDGNEIAIIGYDEGHTNPFIYVFNNFSGNNFFSGTHKRYELTANKKIGWQVESISYADNDSFFISCEKTADVPNTLYRISKSELALSSKH